MLEYEHEQSFEFHCSQVDISMDQNSFISALRDISGQIKDQSLLPKTHQYALPLLKMKEAEGES